jgi:glycosyltransferase involved in cell wall biosynthesis
MSDLEISVVIPAYNGASYLRDAIESVLAQARGQLEVIVIDDGSTDNTRDVAAKYAGDIRYIFQPNRGVASARNRGIQESSGRLVALLDGDDTWLPGKLDKQLEALGDFRAGRVCFTGHIATDENLAPVAVDVPSRGTTTLADLLLKGNVAGSLSSALIDRDLLIDVGGFNPTLSYCADWELWIRLARRTDFVNVKAPLVTYRQHGTNMSRNVSRLEKESLQILEAAFSDPSTPEPIRALRLRAIGYNWMVLAGSYFWAHRPVDFARCIYHALIHDPRQVGRLLAFPHRRLAGTSDWRART